MADNLRIITEIFKIENLILTTQIVLYQMLPDKLQIAKAHAEQKEIKILNMSMKLCNNMLIHGTILKLLDISQQK